MKNIDLAKTIEDKIFPTLKLEWVELCRKWVVDGTKFEVATFAMEAVPKAKDSYRTVGDVLQELTGRWEQTDDPRQQLQMGRRIGDVVVESYADVLWLDIQEKYRHCIIDLFTVDADIESFLDDEMMTAVGEMQDQIANLPL